MFTGLIEDVGQFLRLDRSQGQTRIVLQTALPMETFTLGESIAVNGVCLTVVRWGDGTFFADVSRESLTCTRLGSLKPGDPVNLERALRVGDRLGGHIVSGHVDGIGTIVHRKNEQNTVVFDVEIPAEISRYVVQKGSVAVDGISLTVNQVNGNRFSLAIIPHSLKQTNLELAAEGSKVHIETDILGRYVERLMAHSSASETPQGLSLNALAKNGFL